MTSMDRAAFARALDRLYATWAKPTPSERILAAAWDALEDFEIDIVETACKALIAAGGKFMPSTADLRDECRVQRQQSHIVRVPLDADAPACAACEGAGQVLTRTEAYEVAPPGRPARTMMRSYWAPCTACARGRRMAANRTRTSAPTGRARREGSAA